MQHALILMPIALPCLLAACGDSVSVGAPRLEPPPAAALRECRHPAEFLPAGAKAQGAIEIAVGRIGDELIRCRNEKAALAAWAQGVIGALDEGRDAE